MKWAQIRGGPGREGQHPRRGRDGQATMELTARGDGVLRAILVQEGAAAPVGDVIAVIAGPDEDISEFAAPVSASLAAGAEGGAATAQAPATAADVATTSARPAEDGRRIRASPLARRLGRRLGSRPRRRNGSGPAGRIVKLDIEAALAEGVPRAPALVAPQALSDPDYEDVPLTQMRKTIAHRLVESLGPGPALLPHHRRGHGAGHRSA